MTLKNAILEMLEYRKTSQVVISEKMGYKYPSAIGQMLKRGNVTVSVLSKMADLMDYEVVLQPKRITGKRPEGQIVIDRSEEQ